MKYSILIIFFTIHSAFSFDFSKYTVINEETQKFLQSNRKKKHPDSSVIPGEISLFGNSITVEDDFWTNILGSSLGTVPGTLDSSYSRTAKCAQPGMTIWDAGYCSEVALTSVKPEVVIIMFGTIEALDAMSNTGWEKWREQYEEILDALMSIGTIPIISTIPPLYDQLNSTDVPSDTINKGVNKAIRSLAEHKQVVLVDYHQAMVDYTGGDIFNKKWWDDTYIHPSGNCDPDTSEPTCGYGIRNAVCWHAVNKVYRIIIDDDPPDIGNITYISIKDGQKELLGSNYVFRAAAIPGTSNIKLSFGPHFRPKTVRLLNVKGKTLRTKVTFKPQEALISTKSMRSGVYFIEANLKGKTYYLRVLLTY